MSIVAGTSSSACCVHSSIGACIRSSARMSLATAFRALVVICGVLAMWLLAMGTTRMLEMVSVPCMRTLRPAAAAWVSLPEFLRTDQMDVEPRFRL